jgi:hypothetical protein
MTTNNNPDFVAVGKPAPEGAAFIAPPATALPTDAASALASAFVCVGYAGDAGLTNSVTTEATEIKAWGGKTVLNVQSSYAETYTLRLIECMNPVVLTEIFGKNNVIEDEGLIRVAHTAQERTYHPWVFDLIVGDKLKRCVIPSGKITAVGDIIYSDSEAIGYDITISCQPNEAGETSIEYIQTESIDN